MSTRRSFLCGSAGAIAAGLAAPGLVPGPAVARMPVSGTQVPGFYRDRLGRFEITVVSDGTISFPTEALWPEAAPEEREAVLASDFQPTDTAVLQVNVMAVNTGDRLVLIDAGSRGKMMPTANHLLRNLEAAGIGRENVDLVLITHEHPDHLWGVADPGDTEPTFPNAEYVIGEEEWNFWAQPDHPLASHEIWGDVYHQNNRTVAVVRDRIRTVKAGEEVVPGIGTIPTPGHTPGHMSVHLASDGQELICTGDVVGNRAVAFRHPDWRGGFDLDLDQGARTRRAFLDRCAGDKVLVASYHLPFPGLGHVARDGTAFRWVPAEMRLVL